MVIMVVLRAASSVVTVWSRTERLDSAGRTVTCGARTRSG
jgi:hypothetical protein